MRKTLKVFALAVMAVCMSLVLCSCNALDETRANRADIVTRDGVTTLQFRGNEYTPFVLPLGGAQLITTDCGTACYPDVPLLLTEWYGTRFDRSEDCMIIEFNGILYLSSAADASYADGLKQLSLDRFCAKPWWAEDRQMFNDATTAALNATLAGPCEANMVFSQSHDGWSSESYIFYAVDSACRFAGAEYSIIVDYDGGWWLQDWTNLRLYRIPDKYIETIENGLFSNTAAMWAYDERYSGEWIYDERPEV